jgi:hypothetical protein
MSAASGQRPTVIVISGENRSHHALAELRP